MTYRAEESGLTRRQFIIRGGAAVALAGGASSIFLSSCAGGGETIGGGEGDGGGGGGNTFIFGRGADSVGLDPINVTDGESLIVTRQIFDGLLDFAPGSTDVIPSLATEVPDPEDGGRAYTFKLRQGVKFHDGEPLNAEAVVFNFERWMNTENEYHKGGGSQSSDFAYYSSMFGGFDDDSVLESVEAVDENTVRFTLKEPLGPFTRNIAMSPFGIASPKAIQDDVENFWKNPVGTGPFKFVKWEQGSTVEVEANDEWWGADAEGQGGGPHVDRVIFRSIPDNTARVAALNSGDLTAADGLTPDDVPTIEQSDNLKVQTRPPLNIGYMAMNTQKKPFDDPKVRQAVVHAINMQKVVDGFFGDTASVAGAAVPPTVPFYNDSIKPYEHNPQRAKELLAEAGMEDGFETNLWYMPIPRPYMPDGKGIAQAIQQDLQQVGINAKLETREWGTYLEATGRGEHAMALLGWTGDNGDPDNFLNVLLSSDTATEENAQNIAYYKNPEVDDLLQQGLTTIDENERRDVYMEAQQIIYDDAPWAPIAYAEPPLGFQNQVEDYEPSPTGGEPFNTVRLSESGA